MSKLLIVTSSVREGRAADNILNFVTSELSNHEITIADLKELPMPFFNAPASPSSEDYVATEPNVIKWGKLVSEADGVVFLVAEYNHSLTGVLKNAIDWLYSEWNGKPVTFVGYGWVGGMRAIADLRGIMASTLAAKATETDVKLHFMKEIDLTGVVTDQQTASSELKTAVEELVTIIA
jgi:NAD(P)H-dependent FMN reductase